MGEDCPVVDPLAERVGVEDAAEEHDGFFGRVPVLKRIAGRDSSATSIFFGGLSHRLAGGCRALGCWLRLRSGGVRCTSGATLLRLLLVDGNLIIVMAISIPVSLVRLVRSVRRWRMIVDAIVAVVVDVIVVVVNNLGAHIASRLRRTTLPLAMGALERRSVGVAAWPFCPNITKISTYKFGLALGHCVVARGRVATTLHELGWRPTRGRPVRVLGRNGMRCASTVVALYVGGGSRGGRETGRVLFVVWRHGGCMALSLVVVGGRRRIEAHDCDGRLPVASGSGDGGFFVVEDPGNLGVTSRREAERGSQAGACSPGKFKLSEVACPGGLSGDGGGGKCNSERRRKAAVLSAAHLVVVGILCGVC